MEFVTNSTCFFHSLAGIKVFSCIFFDCFGHCQSRPRSFDIDFRILIGKFRCAVGCHCTGHDNLLGLIDDVFDISIGLICFNRGKFRIVTGIHTFVTEVTGNFKNAFIAAHKKSFQIQFGSDTHVHGHIQCIKVGDKRSGIGTAV